jgi:hypothetical protein
MRLFAIFVLAPALAFNLYVMYRFWCEMNQRKFIRGHAGRAAAVFLTTRARRGGNDAQHMIRRSESDSKTDVGRAVVIFASGSKKRAERDRF